MYFKAYLEYKELHINFPLLLRYDKKWVINKILSCLELLEELSLTGVIQTAVFQLLFLVMDSISGDPRPATSWQNMSFQLLVCAIYCGKLLIMPTG